MALRGFIWQTSFVWFKVYLSSVCPSLLVPISSWSVTFFAYICNSWDWSLIIFCGSEQAEGGFCWAKKYNWGRGSTVTVQHFFLQAILLITKLSVNLQVIKLINAYFVHLILFILCIQCWVPLKYHGSKSDFSARYLQRMLAQEKSNLHFTMNPYVVYGHFGHDFCKLFEIISLVEWFNRTILIFIMIITGMNMLTPCALEHVTITSNPKVVQEGMVTFLLF